MWRICLMLGLGPAALHCANGSLQGQNAALGFKGGVNLGDVSSDQFVFGRAGRRTAFVGGVFLTLTGTQRVSFQPELLYSQKGISILGQGGSAIAAINYVDIPLLVRVGLSEEGRKIRPSLFGGGFVGFEVGCSISGDIVGLDENGGCDALLEGRGESDAGLVFGAGVDVGLADRFFLTLDGRYNLGLLNLRWEQSGDTVRSRVWSFMGGIGVLLGA